MGKGDIDYLATNNIDCTIEDENGNNQRAILVANSAVPGAVQDVAIQDQTTPLLIIKMNQITNQTTLAANAVLNDYEIEVLSNTGIVAGSYIIMFSDVTTRYYKGYVLSILGNVITMDTPLDSDFPIGSFVDIAITNMNVDGSTIPQIFGIRGLETPENIGITFDITRIIITCLTDSAVDLSKFGDLEALTRGIVLRKRNGETFNVFNVKSNAELEGITLDWKPYVGSNPAQGQDGFSCRLTFAGQQKLGVVIRLEPGEDMELVVQDNLEGLTFFEIVAEGHEVEL